MEPKLNEITNILNILTRTCELLIQNQANYSAYDLSTKPNKEQWSQVEVLSHLLACHNEQVKRKQYPKLPYFVLLKQFLDERELLVLYIKNLPEVSWARTKIYDHKKFTVFSQLRRTANHEKGHWNQIKENHDQI